jgi:hypothetical protein
VGSAAASALDPLLDVLALNHSDDSDLALRIQDLFLVREGDGRGRGEERGKYVAYFSRGFLIYFCVCVDLLPSKSDTAIPYQVYQEDQDVRFACPIC